MDPNPQASLEVQKKKRRKKVLLYTLFIALNVAVIVITAVHEFSGDHPDRIEAHLGPGNFIFLICGVLSLVFALMMETVKFLLMMRALGEKVSLRTAFQVGALGKYYDCITPSGAGGQPFQIWFLHTREYSSGASAAMPLMSFFTMQFGFILLAIPVFLFNGDVIENPAIKVSAYIGMTLYSIVPLLLLFFAIAPKAAEKCVLFFIKLGAKMHLVKNQEATSTKVVGYLTEYRDSLLVMAKKPALLPLLLLFSILYQLGICSLPFFVIRTFSGGVSFITALSLCIFVYASVTYIPTPGNSGAAEGSFYLIFSSLGANSLFWAMLIWRVLCYYSFIIIGIGIYGFNAWTGRKRSNRV